MTHRERYDRLAAKVRAAEANDPYRKYVSLAGDLLGLCGELLEIVETYQRHPSECSCTAYWRVFLPREGERP